MGDSRLLKEIGSRVSSRRKYLHLTQEKLAEKMGVSVQMISNVELGHKAIRPENLIKLCSVLEVSTDHILCGNCSAHDVNVFSQKFSQLSAEQRQIIEMLVDSLVKSNSS